MSRSLWGLRIDFGVVRGQLVVRGARVVNLHQWRHAVAGSDAAELLDDPLAWILTAEVRDEFDGCQVRAFDLLADEVAK